MNISGTNGRAVHLFDPRPPGTRPAFAATAKNFVAVRDDGCTVLKYPTGIHPYGMQHLHGEAARYVHLGPHDNLVVFKEMCEDGLVLGYCERGTLYDILEEKALLTDRQKVTIGKQVTRGLIHLHKHGYIHCDLNVHNVFITSDMEAKIGDLQGQLYNSNGTIAMEALAEENVRSRHPYAGEDEFSARTDIFALGTLLYHVWHGHPIFPGLSEYSQEGVEEIRTKLQKGEFPLDGVNAIGMDKIIRKCWQSGYKTVEEVLNDMDTLDEEKLRMPLIAQGVVVALGKLIRCFNYCTSNLIPHSLRITQKFRISLWGSAH